MQINGLKYGSKWWRMRLNVDLRMLPDAYEFPENEKGQLVRYFLIVFVFVSPGFLNFAFTVIEI
jgi:hypothetical protein